MPRRIALLPALALAGAIGCGESPRAPRSATAAGRPATPRPESPEPPAAHWGVEPIAITKASTTGKLAGYTFALPEGYEPVDNLSVAGFSEAAAWAVPDDRDGVVVGGIFSGPRALIESNDMPRLLTDLAKSAAEMVNQQVVELGTAESRDLLGCKFTRISWTARVDEDRPALGAAFGAFDGERVVIFTLFTAGDDAAAKLKRLEAGVVGLTKSPPLD